MNIRKKLKKIIPLIMIALLITTLLPLEKAYASTSILTALSDGNNNCINLSWTIPDNTQNYSYRLYSKASTDSTYQSIPSKSKIKVLNIYPNIGNNLKSWMENNGYGKGLISVDEVPISTFNNNPNVKDSNGNYYDAIFVGAWDCNNNQDLSLNAMNVIENFIRMGRGVLIGHDVIWQTNANRLATYLNLQRNSSATGYTQIRTTKKGLLTNYPWQIGETLNVPMSHTSGYSTTSDVWFQYTGNSWGGGQYTTDSTNHYLITYNNVALIQTGHAGGTATPDEQMILANTLFYLSQVTTDTSWSDHKGQDLANPNSTNVTGVVSNSNNSQITINYNNATDNGSTYNYYVEATGESNNIKTQSNIQTATITSGISGYAIAIDQNPNTTPNKIVTTPNTSYTFNNPYTGNYYIHVASIDKAGNMSTTTHYLVQDSTKPTAINYYVDNITGDGYDVYVTGVLDDLSGINRVQFPTWTDYKGQDDIDTNWGDSSMSKGTNLGNGTWKFHVNRSAHNNEYGSYTTHIYVYDNSGNYNCVGGVKVVLDITPPDLVVSENTTNWTNQNVTLTATATDTQSGVKRIQLPDGNWVNSNTTPYIVNSNGVYKFIAEDVRGNQITKSITVNNIDKTTPTGTITQNPTAWTNNDVALTVIGYDNESGVKSITKPDETVVSGNSTKYMANTNGTYVFVVTDNVGNTFAKSYTINNIDKILPTLKLTLDSDLITNKTVTINANASDGESGIQSITKPDGTIVNGSSTSYTVDKNGVYSFKSTDVAGNVIIVSITINNIITINTVSEIDHIEYKLEGATTQDWTTYNSLAIVNEGITTIHARAVDKAGNYSDIVTSVVKLDRSVPINTTIKIVVS